MFPISKNISASETVRLPVIVVSAGLSLAIFLYVALRAANLSITHDEALTYAWHVRGGWWEIITFRTPGLPDNNHVLHTLLCKLSVDVLGLSEFSLRIPTLLGCFIFLVGLNCCLRRLVSGWWHVVGLLVVALNPYIIDYLGVARGYGLGLGFTLMGLAILLDAMVFFPQKIRTTLLPISVFLFMCAVLANLSFLLILAAALVVFIFGLMYCKYWFSLLKLLILLVPFILYIRIPMEILKERKLFGIGGHSGLWLDTVGSLLNGTTQNGLWLGSALWLVDIGIVFILLVLPYALWSLFRLDRKRFVSFLIIATILSIVILSSLLQHIFFSVALLEGRRGIYLIPLFLMTSLAITHLPVSNTGRIGVLLRSAYLIVLALLIVQSLTLMNMKYIFDWKYDASSKDAIGILRSEINKNNPSKPVRVRVDWIFEPSFNFYRRTMNIEELMSPLDGAGLDGDADYYYGLTHQEGLIRKREVKRLREFDVSNTCLFSRENR